MSKRDDISSILIIGAGPIIIGQACEFDYSGTQATRALKEEGYRVVLVNSNPATIMTDPNLADATYIEPLTVDYLESIIIKEKPDAILPTVGGQTALNLALKLSESGMLNSMKIELIGAKKDSIEKAEDRRKFKKAMTEPEKVIAPTAAPIAISIKLASLIFPGVPRLKAVGFINAEIATNTAARPTKL